MCRELIRLRSISLIDVSLPGIVYRVLLLNQSLPPRLYIILDLLIYLYTFFRIKIYFVFIMLINL